MTYDEAMADCRKGHAVKRPNWAIEIVYIYGQGFFRVWLQERTSYVPTPGDLCGEDWQRA